jgi:undecaprenyl-diphosphatase
VWGIALDGLIVYLKALVLAAVEGITEFLPISSTGHLILVERGLQLTDDPSFNDAFIVIIQLPAILSVVLYFWKDLWPFVPEASERTEKLTLWAKILVAFIPAALLGPFVSDFLETHLFAPIPVSIALLVGGIILILIEQHPRDPAVSTVADITFKTAFIIGLFQCLAMIPGTSRSAATIIGAMLLGTSRPVAAKFSFFLAIPTMFGATVYTLVKNGVEFTNQEWAILTGGSVASFIVAYAVIAVFMGYIRRGSFAVFGYYRIALAAIVLIFYFLHWLNGDSPSAGAGPGLP